MWAGNIPEWVVLEFGAALAGLTLVTVNPALRLSEARHVLSDSQAAGVFLVREYRGVSLERLAVNVRPEAPGLREVVFFDQWDQFLRDGGTEPAAASALLPEVQPGDPAQIQYTSGTTGPPKGAALSHRGIVNNARFSYGQVLGMRRGDVFVNPMPLFHTAGCVLATLGPMAALASQVLVPYFDPALVLHRFPGINRVCKGFGLDITKDRIPVRPGRNLATLVEVAARNLLLKIQGTNSAQAFRDELNRAMEQQQTQTPPAALDAVE